MDQDEDADEADAALFAASMTPLCFDTTMGMQRQARCISMRV